MRGSRKRAVEVFGEDLVHQAEGSTTEFELQLLQELAGLMRGAVPKGDQAWLLRVRTFVDGLPAEQRLAAVRTIAGGVRGELARLAARRVAASPPGRNSGGDAA